MAAANILHFASALRLAFQQPVEADRLPALTAGAPQTMLRVGVSERAKESLTSEATQTRLRPRDD